MEVAVLGKADFAVVDAITPMLNHVVITARTGWDVKFLTLKHCDETMVVFKTKVLAIRALICVAMFITPRQRW